MDAHYWHFRPIITISLFCWLTGLSRADFMFHINDRTSDDHFFRDSLIHFLFSELPFALLWVGGFFLLAFVCTLVGKEARQDGFLLWSKLVLLLNTEEQKRKRWFRSRTTSIIGVRKAEVKVDENLLWNIKSITATFIHHSNGPQLPFWDADC